MIVYKKHIKKIDYNYLIDSSVTDCFIAYCFEEQIIKLRNQNEKKCRLF